MKTSPTRPEDSIHGRKISREEALKGLGDPKTWPRDKKKAMNEFRKKPRVRTVRTPRSPTSGSS